MPVAEELLQISKMHIDIESKNWLRDNLLTEVGTMHHIRAIAGVLDLLELRLEVMLTRPAPSPFSDEACIEVADRIHNLAIDLNNAAKQAQQERRNAQARQGSTVLVEERPRFKPGHRASRSRRTW